MHRVRFALALLVLGAAGVVTAFVVVPASGSPSSVRAVAAATVNVVGTDTAARISPKSVPLGAVTFKVANKGAKKHVFSVDGKRIAVKPHKTAKAKVTFKAAGKFKWTWTGTKKISGVLTVRPPGGGGGGGGTTSTATTTTTVATTTTTTTMTTTTTPTACTTPTTTVQVGMFEYRFELDKSSFPAGCIQFVITNKGMEQHNFDISGKRSGEILAPGGTETWNVQLTAGTYNYVCDVPFHIDRGMVGQFTVT